MTNEILKSALIISASILVYAIMDRSKPDFHFEIHGDQAGFSVRTNSVTGDRCLLNEGAVRSVQGWEGMAKHYPVPLELCNSAKENRVVFSDKTGWETISPTPKSKSEGPIGMFDHLVPENKKK
jgi:hypothetical protein